MIPSKLMGIHGNENGTERNGGNVMHLVAFIVLGSIHAVRIPMLQR